MVRVLTHILIPEPPVTGRNGAIRNRDQPPTMGLDVAEELHRRFGYAVGLQVGPMTYPDRRIVSLLGLLPSSLIKAEEIMTRLEGPHEVSSGRTVDTDLRLQSSTAVDIAIYTQGEWTDTRLVNPATGEVVGGDRGFDEGSGSQPGTWDRRMTVRAVNLDAHHGDSRVSTMVWRNSLDVMTTGRTEIGEVKIVEVEEDAPASGGTGPRGNRCRLSLRGFRRDLVATGGAL